MDKPPFEVSLLVNQSCFAKTLVDNGCSSYGICDDRFARKHSLQRIQIEPRTIEGFDDLRLPTIREVVSLKIDLDGYEHEAFFYIVPRLASYDVILGQPWMVKHDVVLRPRKNRLWIKKAGIVVRNEWSRPRTTADIKQIMASVFTAYSTKKRKNNVEVFAATMADIQKALRKKTVPDPRTLLPSQYHEFLDLFDRTKAEELPPLRGKRVDHAIELEKEDGKEKEVPWGPLYSMSRDELLVLRRTLTELLDKGFIRVSNSPAAAPVLFVRKPGGGLRFCVDYRALNKITRKDRYPLPLIYDTLRNIGKAKWFTKLDVIAAFHKIRVAEGDEWKTAFRTRYGLYEWMVTPFGLANAPSTFQKYINWALREYLDEFCSAYVDDILIYTDGSLKEHQDHVWKVMAKLQDAGLQVDIEKCEFEVHRTKYLGFIIEAGQGIKMDPVKVEAIVQWESPTSVKSVQSFLGFANFYRKFISGFSRLAKPITDLVRKDGVFKWTDEAETAFRTLKHMFITGPILVQFDPDRTTIVETDASGWSLGGALFQIGDDGLQRPCAFFSKKMNSAECNYEIYDKEMLAIVRCLEEWDTDLRSVKSFEIRTDHKNLEYFMTARKLTERQMRWSITLSKFNFELSYIKGSTNTTADALSRRAQDTPQNDADERVAHRTMQLLPDTSLQGLPARIRLSPVQVIPAIEERALEIVGEAEPLVELWAQGMAQDHSYAAIIDAIQKGDRKFKPELKLQVSIAECSMEDDKLQFRGRRWVPNLEELRTKLIQRTHDSVMAGHPGREVLSAVLSRQFFWPGMLADIRRFVRNCDSCRSNKAWRERKQGFLKPLPVPTRLWKEVSVDFIVGLPKSLGCTNIMVVTDRLGKGVIFEPMKTITAEALAEAFVRRVFSQHGLPDAIVSDRGTQFIGELWKRVCGRLKIQRRLSTAWHPETDGSTERMNSTLEEYLRAYANFLQDDWSPMLPIAELAINNRDASSTGVSPFFLTHGYNFETIRMDEPLLPYEDGNSPVQKADDIVRKLQDAIQWAQTCMAIAQQVQEEAANRKRQAAVSYKVGDKVWLDLRNIRTNRKSKKLDAKNAKFTVTETIGSHAFRLDVPKGIHNVFHSNLLRPAYEDPFPSQKTTDDQPGPTIVGATAEEDEYTASEILDVRTKKKGRGTFRQYLVKWQGYATPSWEWEWAVADLEVLDTYEARTG